MTPAYVLVFIIIPAVAACLIGRGKGFPWWGLFMGALLSYLGLIIVALWRPAHKELVRRERARLAAEREARGGS